MQSFTITLQAARVNAGLTQERLAQLLGVHRTTLHNWETGKTSPDLAHLRKVSLITGVPMDYLFLPDVLPKVDKRAGEGLPGKMLGVALGLALALAALGPGRLCARAGDSAPSLCIRYVCTETDPLNVRDGPSRHAPWVYRLDRGEAVTVHEVKDGWAYVERCGDYGWAWAAYLGEGPPADKLPEAWLAVEEDEPWPPARKK